MSIEISRLSERLIKSTAEVSVDHVEIGENGQRLNRNWMVVHEETGKFVLSSDNHKMIWIEPSIQDKSLILSANPKSGFTEQIAVPINDTGFLREVEMFDSTMRYEAVDDGDEAADWLQRFLDMEGVRLVHMPQNYERRDSSGVARFGFSDSWSGSLGGEESLEVLNTAIKLNGRNPVLRERFGHDMWVSGADPFEEDAWGEIRIGGPDGLSVAVVKPIVRCSRTLVRREAVDWKGLEKKDREPLATLNQIRKTVQVLPDGKRKTNVIFGQKLAPIWKGKSHTINVGAKVEITATKPRPVLE